MSRVSSSLLAGLAASVITAGGLYYHQRSRADESSRLRAANAQLRLQVSARHAAQIAPQETRTTTLVKPKPASAKLQDPRAPESDYRNEGQSSPVATLQTFAWACDRGDAARIKDLLCFEPQGRQKAEAFMAALPSEVRERWNSPEAMAADLLTQQGMQQPFPAATILARALPEEAVDGRVTLRLPGTPKDGTLYQKIGDRWHYVITEAVVDRYIAEAAQRNTPAR